MSYLGASLRLGPLPGSGVMSPVGDSIFTTMRSPVANIPFGTGLSVDLSRSNIFRLGLTNSATIQTLSNPKDGTKYMFILQQAVGSKTLTWPSSVKWAGGDAPTLTTTSGHFDIVSMMYVQRFGRYFADISQDFS